MLVLCELIGLYFFKFCLEMNDLVELKQTNYNSFMISVKPSGFSSDL